jgi:hypothetical protein
MTGAQGSAIVNILFYVVIGAMVGSQGEQLVMQSQTIGKARQAIADD